jgi:signal transduction histidine kinase
MSIDENKSKKRVKKLFKEIGQLATEPLNGNDHNGHEYQLTAESEAHLAVMNSELVEELSTLRARVAELESELEAKKQRPNEQPQSGIPTRAPAIIYEKDEVGFAFVEDEVLPLQRAPQPATPPEELITTPLVSSGMTIGEMKVTPPPGRDLTEEDLKIANAVAQQVSTQIENLRLLAAAERARAEAEEATRQFTHKNWDSFLDAIHNAERIGYSYDQSAVEPFTEQPSEKIDHQETVQVLDEQIGKLFVKADPSRPLTPSDKDFVNSIARQVSQQVENIRLLADAARSRAEAEEATRRLTRETWQSYTNQRNVLGYMYDSNKVSPLHDANAPQELDFTHPLTVRGEPIGKIAFSGWKDITPDAVELASAVAERVSAQIESLRLSEEIQKRAAELATVAEVSTTSSTTLDPEKLLQDVVDRTKQEFKVYHAHVYLADELMSTLELAAGAGEVGQKMVSEQHSIPFDSRNSVVARAAQERKSQIVNNVRAETGFMPNPYLPDTQSELAIPMLAGDKVLGVFDVQSDILNFFTQEDANIYTTLATQVAVSLQNARLYAEQAATVAQLRELDRLKSSFLANMSHELRTPLNSILGFADVMLEELDGPLTENMNNDLLLIQKNGKHLLHLINDILDMAKIESGKLNLIIEEFNLFEIMEDVNSITSSLANEKNLALYIEPDSDHEVMVNADRTRLRQVLINLVNNAIKFTEKGSISLHARRTDHNVLITVKDTGIGIPPDQLESVFQEFTQVDSSTTRKVGGTGLGLPISRRLIEMHGGRLWAESTGNLGEGSTFYVFMPIEAKVESEPQAKKK